MLDVACAAHDDSNVMMRLWMLSYARPRPVRNAGALSVLAHVLDRRGLWVEATRPPDSMPDEGLANRLYYLPPPDRQMVARGSHESVHYFTLAPGPEVGPGPTVTNLQQPTISVPEHSPQAGERAVDSVTAPPVVGEPEADSAFTDSRGRQRRGAIAEQRGAGLSARPADQAGRGICERALRRRHDRFRRHDVVRGDSRRRTKDSCARCAKRCRTCASHRRRSERARCVRSSSSRSRSASRRRSGRRRRSP